jgi:MoaA/NifB/PqqE/SkfB family radical SAM enzyme
MRARRARRDELTTADALDVVDRLADLGTKEVALHGGEAYLRDDWLEIVRAVRARGMQCTMVTGGRGITARLAQQARDAGMTRVSVSVDGPESTHDDLRGWKGSHAAALQATGYLRDAGVPVGCNTQTNPRNFRELPQVLAIILRFDPYGWQVQLMVPMGREADHEDLWLQAYDMLELMPLVARMRDCCDEDGLKLWPGDNVGYFGPYEHKIRFERTHSGHSGGCGGGIIALGIEAQGDVKGCSAMGAQGFVAGNVRT